MRIYSHESNSRMLSNVGNSSSVYTTGESLLNSGNYEDVLEYSSKILTKDPFDAKALNLKGLALWYLGRRKEAKVYFEQALGLRPKEAILRGNILNNLKRHNEALACYEKAIELHPDNHLAWVYKGLTLTHQKKYEEAIKYYDKAIGINSNSKEAWCYKGIAITYLKNKNYLAALTCISRALEIDPEYIEARLAKAVIHQNALQFGIRVCGRCNQGMKEDLDPVPYWGFVGKLCRHCYELAQENTKVYKAMYIEKNKDAKLPLRVEGMLMIHSLDRNRIVFEPNDRAIPPVIWDDIISCNNVEDNDLELVRKLESEGNVQLKNYLRIEYDTNGNTNSVYFDVGDKNATILSSAINQIVSKMFERKSAKDSQVPMFTVGLEMKSNTDLTTMCPNCNNANPQNATFCNQCGSSLVS